MTHRDDAALLTVKGMEDSELGVAAVYIISILLILISLFILKHIIILS